MKGNNFKDKNYLKIILNINNFNLKEYNNFNLKEYNNIKNKGINLFPLVYQLKIIILLRI